MSLLSESLPHSNSFITNLGDTSRSTECSSYITYNFNKNENSNNKTNEKNLHTIDENEEEKLGRDSNYIVEKRWAHKNDTVSDNSQKNTSKPKRTSICVSRHSSLNKSANIPNSDEKSNTKSKEDLAIDKLELNIDLWEHSKIKSLFIILLIFNYRFKPS